MALLEMEFTGETKKVRVGDGEDTLVYFNVRAVAPSSVIDGKYPYLLNSQLKGYHKEAVRNSTEKLREDPAYGSSWYQKNIEQMALAIEACE